MFSIYSKYPHTSAHRSFHTDKNTSLCPIHCPTPPSTGTLQVTVSFYWWVVRYWQAVGRVKKVKAQGSVCADTLLGDTHTHTHTHRRWRLSSILFTARPQSLSLTSDLCLGNRLWILTCSTELLSCTNSWQTLDMYIHTRECNTHSHTQDYEFSCSLGL